MAQGGKKKREREWWCRPFLTRSCPPGGQSRDGLACPEPTVYPETLLLPFIEMMILASRRKCQIGVSLSFRLHRYEEFPLTEKRGFRRQVFRRGSREALAS